MPEIYEAIQFTTVVLSCSLQKNNPHYHFGIHALHCGPQHWHSCVSEGRWTDNKWINKCSGKCWTSTLHQASNIAWFSIVKLETFSSIYTQLQTEQFAKKITMSKVRTFDGVIFESAHTNVFYRQIHYLRKKIEYIYYELHLDQFAKMIIVFRVRTPYPIIFENLTQQCMVDRPTRLILVHNTWTRVL